VEIFGFLNIHIFICMEVKIKYHRTKRS
jgi:hypothetical protein